MTSSRLSSDAGRTPLNGLCHRVSDDSPNKRNTPDQTREDSARNALRAPGTSCPGGDLVSGVGGSLESLYFAFGTDDVYVTVDAPDNRAAMAMAMAMAATVGSSGAVHNYETVVLLTPAEVDEAMKCRPVRSAAGHESNEPCLA